MPGDDPRDTPRFSALTAVETELGRQDGKWGEQNHPDGTGDALFKDLAELAKISCDQAAISGSVTYRHILLEEVWEAMAESDKEKLKTELVQVAAVAVAWVEKLIREETNNRKETE
ncbi:hypothetical protein SEA_BIG3_47 [Mycobacterium phage Big3]|nr:hypothetical protein SEA_BIG3_47 [Mycobacterium phage Big3]